MNAVDYSRALMRALVARVRAATGQTLFVNRTRSTVTASWLNNRQFQAPLNVTAARALEERIRVLDAIADSIQPAGTAASSLPYAYADGVQAPSAPVDSDDDGDDNDDVTTLDSSNQNTSGVNAQPIAARYVSEVQARLRFQLSDGSTEETEFTLSISELVAIQQASNFEAGYFALIQNNWDRFNDSTQDSNVRIGVILLGVNNVVYRPNSTITRQTLPADDYRRARSELYRSINQARSSRLKSRGFRTLQVPRRYAPKRPIETLQDFYDSDSTEDPDELVSVPTVLFTNENETADLPSRKTRFLETRYGAVPDPSATDSVTLVVSEHARPMVDSLSESEITDWKARWTQYTHAVGAFGDIYFSEYVRSLPPHVRVGCCVFLAVSDLVCWSYELKLRENRSRNSSLIRNHVTIEQLLRHLNHYCCSIGMAQWTLADVRQLGLPLHLFQFLCKSPLYFNVMVLDSADQVSCYFKSDCTKYCKLSPRTLVLKVTGNAHVIPVHGYVLRGRNSDTFIQRAFVTDQDIVQYNDELVKQMMEESCLNRVELDAQELAVEHMNNRTGVDNLLEAASVLGKRTRVQGTPVVRGTFVSAQCRLFPSYLLCDSEMFRMVVERNESKVPMCRYRRGNFNSHIYAYWKDCLVPNEETGECTDRVWAPPYDRELSRDPILRVGIVLDHIYSCGRASDASATFGIDWSLPRLNAYRGVDKRLITNDTVRVSHTRSVRNPHQQKAVARFMDNQYTKLSAEFSDEVDPVEHALMQRSDFTPRQIALLYGYQVTFDSLMDGSFLTENDIDLPASLLTIVILVDSSEAMADLLVKIIHYGIMPVVNVRDTDICLIHLHGALPFARSVSMRRSGIIRFGDETGIHNSWDYDLVTFYSTILRTSMVPVLSFMSSETHDVFSSFMHAPYSGPSMVLRSFVNPDGSESKDPRGLPQLDRSTVTSVIQMSLSSRRIYSLDLVMAYTSALFEVLPHVPLVSPSDEFSVIPDWVTMEDLKQFQGFLLVEVTGHGDAFFRSSRCMHYAPTMMKHIESMDSYEYIILYLKSKKVLSSDTWKRLQSPRRTCVRIKAWMRESFHMNMAPRVRPILADILHNNLISSRSTLKQLVNVSIGLIMCLADKPSYPDPAIILKASNLDFDSCLQSPEEIADSKFKYTRGGVEFQSRSFVIGSDVDGQPLVCMVPCTSSMGSSTKMPRIQNLGPLGALIYDLAASRVAIAEACILDLDCVPVAYLTDEIFFVEGERRIDSSHLDELLADANQKVVSRMEIQTRDFGLKVNASRMDGSVNPIGQFRLRTYEDYPGHVKSMIDISCVRIMKELYLAPRSKDSAAETILDSLCLSNSYNERSNPRPFTLVDNLTAAMKCSELLITADCPGSGKTELCIRKAFQECYESGFHSTAIMLCFSNATVIEMKKRVERMRIKEQAAGGYSDGEGYPVDVVRVFTIHKFLMRYAPLFAVLQEFMRQDSGVGNNTTNKASAHMFKQKGSKKKKTSFDPEDVSMTDPDSATPDSESDYDDYCGFRERDTVVIVDELGCVPYKVMTCLYFLLTHARPPTVKYIIATSDPNQLPPVNDSVPEIQHLSLVRDMFPLRYNLNVCHRMINEEQNLRMVRLCEQLRSIRDQTNWFSHTVGVVDPTDPLAATRQMAVDVSKTNRKRILLLKRMCKDFGIQTHLPDDIPALLKDEANAKLRALCYSNKTCNMLCRLMIGDIKETLEVGMLFTNRGLRFVEGITDNYTVVNANYEVTRIIRDERRTKIVDVSLQRVGTSQDHEITIKLSVLIKNFMFHRVSTVHCSQGCTIEDPVLVYGIGGFVDFRLLYVAMTRCVRFENLSVVL